MGERSVVARVRDNHVEGAEVVDCASNDHLADVFDARHGFAGDGALGERGRAFDEGSVCEDLVAGNELDVVSDLDELGGDILLLDCALGGVGVGGGASAFGRLMRLKSCPWPCSRGIDRVK